LVDGTGDFGTVSVTDDQNAMTIGGNAATLNAVAATTLTLSGGSYTDLNASAGTQIDQSGALTVSGTTTLTADGAGVTVLLNGSGNDFNTVSLVDGTGDFGTVSVTDDQNAMTIGGNAATLNAVAATTLTLSGGNYTDLNASG